MVHSVLYKQKQSPRGIFQERCSTNNLDSLQENIHANACLQSAFACKYATYLQQNTTFREHFWRTVSVYCSNIEVVIVEVHSKQVKNYLKYISIL